MQRNLLKICYHASKWGVCCGGEVHYMSHAALGTLVLRLAIGNELLVKYIVKKNTIETQIH